MSGKVTDANDESLPGVTIRVKDTSIGAITDFDGNYSLVAGKDAILVFTYVGFASQEVVIGQQTRIDIVLEEDLEVLDEVVVTAFGIEQEKRTLNYAVQGVDGDDLAKTQQQNLVNSLQGKVAGVQVTASSGSPGSSTNIVIRGGTSISESRSNEPLFVIDGIIMDNSTFQGSGNRGMDINPDDVESITILKGPAAAALYGIGAGNGAVIITTKSGKSGSTQVGFSTTIAFDRVFNTHDVQTTYGRGRNNVFDDETTLTWGPALAVSDEKFSNLDDFFQTGVQQKYDINVSGGTENSTFYLSLSNNNQTGIVPNESYNRLSALLKGSTKLRDNLNISANTNLIITDNVRGGAGSMNNAFTWPVDDNMSEYLNQDGTKNWLIDDLDPVYNNPENPYWRVNNNLPEYEIRRTINQVFLDWDVLEGVKATYRIGGDFSNQYYRRVTVPESAGSSDNFGGRIFESEKSSQRITSTFNLSYSKNIGDWNIYALGGHNLNMVDVRTISYSGSNFLLPSLISINNVNTPYELPRQSNIDHRWFGAYSEVRVDYKGIASVGITGRKDWSSSLPQNNNSFFYPSVSTGLVLTEVINNSAITDVMSYGKVRFSYAESGQDVAPERLNEVLEQYPGLGGGYKYDFFAGNPNLKPEFLKAREIGLELQLFKGRLGVDIANYETRSTDMIIQSRISTASGWVIQYFNSGDMVNKGWEVILDQKMINQPNLKWSTNLVFSRNRSKLSKLPGYISQLPVTSGQIINEARPVGFVDRPLFAINGVPYLRNENGELVLDENGYPRSGTYAQDENGEYILDDNGLREISFEDVYLGNREPDWLLGITNSFDYKDFSLSFLVDIRKGGDVINATASHMLRQGVHPMLDEWRNKKYTFNGVIETAEGFVPNTNEVVLDEAYFRFNHRTIGENFVEDGSWVKIRYVALGYNARQVAKILKIRSLRANVTLRNIAMWSKYSGGDPEKDYNGSSVGGAGTVGLDYFNVPNTQGITVGLKANF